MRRRFVDWINQLSDRSVQILLSMGRLVLLTGQVFTRGFRRPFDGKSLLFQLETVGVESIAIAVLTSVFSSMVMTVQLAVQLSRFSAKEYVSHVISISLVRELGPVLTALMVGGRVGAGITAEIGSMSVTEQVDALRSMGAEPIKKLVAPRVLATVIILPLLTTLSNVLGLFGATLIGWMNLGIHPQYFLQSALHAITLEDFVSGMIKPIFFGFFISVVACYQGLSTRGGTEQVGEATTRAVVTVSIVTLVSDFILTNLLLGIGL